MLLGDLTKGREATSSGVGKENVEPTLLAFNGGIDTVEVCKVGDVTADASNVAFNEFHGGVEFGLAAASDEDIRAFGHKPLAVARPMPLLPPVTRAIFPESLSVLMTLATFVGWLLLRTERYRIKHHGQETCQ